MLLASKRGEILEDEIGSRKIVNLEDVKFVKILNAIRKPVMEILESQALEFIIHVEIKMLAEKVTEKSI